MKRYFLLSLLIFFCLAAVLPKYAFAHFPAVDGTITVTLHVDPDDDPTPGQQANLYFLFDDTTKKFALENCNCIVSVGENGKTLFEEQLTAKSNTKPSIWGAQMPYVFPANNVYYITLVGKPKTVSTFQQFAVAWYFRVDPVNPGLVQQRQSDVPIIIMVMVAALVFLSLFGYFIKKELFDDAVDNKKERRYNKNDSTCEKN